MIRLRDEWVEMDPRQWNAGMDAVINVGLGTGSRDRDMAMLNNILQTQIAFTDRFQASGMSTQAIDMIPRVVKTATKIAEAAGIRNAEAFYPEIKPEDMEQIKQQADAAAKQPPPEVQIAQQKMQAEMQVQQAKIAGEQQKSQAELQLKQQEGAADLQLEQQKMQMEFALKREQLAAEIQLKREQLIAELALKREQMQAQNELQREAGLMKGMNDGVKASSDVHVGGDPG